MKGTEFREILIRETHQFLACFFNYKKKIILLYLRLRLVINCNSYLQNSFVKLHPNHLGTMQKIS